MKYFLRLAFIAIALMIHSSQPSYAGAHKLIPATLGAPAPVPTPGGTGGGGGTLGVQGGAVTTAVLCQDFFIRSGQNMLHYSMTVQAAPGSTVGTFYDPATGTFIFDPSKLKLQYFVTFVRASGPGAFSSTQNVQGFPQSLTAFTAADAVNAIQQVSGLGPNDPVVIGFGMGLGGSPQATPARIVANYTASMVVFAQVAVKNANQQLNH